MKKHGASSKESSAREKGFNSVEQAFAHYFPRDKKTTPQVEGRESGSELAERLFQKIVHSKK